MTAPAAAQVAPLSVGVSRGALLRWGVAVLAYAVAVCNRTSMSVAGLAAQQRFGIEASALSLFAVLQLGVYAAMQVPAGALVDRFGPRRMMVAGAILMAAGQLATGAAEGLPAALAARVLVGGGDAMTLVSVMRLLPAWFTGTRVPMMTQLTAMVGHLGQLLALSPLLALLGSVGWTGAFAVLAGCGLAVGALVAGVVPNLSEDQVGGRGAPRGKGVLLAAWREPGTRLGFWAHFVTLFPGAAFAFLWGYPFLVRGQGRSPATAASLLSSMVFVALVTGLVIGRVVGRQPSRRSTLVVTIVVGTALVWTAVLAWPGPAPLWLLVALVAVLSASGPGSMIGFDYARTGNPSQRLGTATGIVNVGGFVATIAAILVIGLLLEVTTFRWAFSVAYPLWALGSWRFLHHLRHSRRTDAGRRT